MLLNLKPRDFKFTQVHPMSDTKIPPLQALQPSWTIELFVTSMGLLFGSWLFLQITPSIFGIFDASLNIV